MDCRRTRKLLELHVLGALSDLEGKAVTHHLAGCPRCRDLCAGLESAARAVADSAAPHTPSEDFQHRLAAAVTAEIATAGSTHRRPVDRSWGWARAALLALAFTGGALLTLLVGREAGSFSSRADEADGSDRPVLSFQELWAFAGVSAHEASLATMPVALNGLAFVVERTEGGERVAAVRAADGSRLWVSDQPTAGYLAADHNALYTIAPRPANASLLALDIRTGKVLWRFDAPESGRAGMCAATRTADGVCWVSAGQVFMLDRETGRVRWRHDVGTSGLLSRPAWEGRSVYVAGAGDVRCLDSETGELRWSKAFDAAMNRFVRPQVSVSRGRVFAVHRQTDGMGSLAGFAADDGSRLWQKRDLGTYHMIARNGDLYVRGQSVRGIDGSTGDALWTRDAIGCSPIAHMNGQIVYADSRDEMEVVAVDARTGERTGGLALAKSCTGFVLCGGLGLVNTNDGVLHAVASLWRLTRSSGTGTARLCLLPMSPGERQGS